ncbi:hypothetical protein OBBRIDRAFT_808211 [Obba rivulosa]|uniref:Uncharacterized protein n=1 Tax=Obba rivulosa TaxID=1052685 RepID=A0A8E2APP9_9APHY|nr:hypothetical protein OBBRIDRAFT_808211 [Obba rivulosa]
MSGAGHGYTPGYLMLTRTRPHQENVDLTWRPFRTFPGLLAAVAAFRAQQSHRNQSFRHIRARMDEGRSSCQMDTPSRYHSLVTTIFDTNSAVFGDVPFNSHVIKGLDFLRMLEMKLE